MKRLAILCGILMMLVMTACTTQKAGDATSKNALPNQMKTTADNKTEEKQKNEYLQQSLFPILQEKGENYQVYTNDAHTGYYYVIFDSKDNVLDEGYCSWKFGDIACVADGVLRLTYSTSGGALFNARYYDVEKGRVSRIYQMPLGVSSSLVAYFSGGTKGCRLRVQDIFDPSVYYREFQDETFSVSVFISQGSAIFSDNNKSVTVTYPIQPEGTECKSFNLY